MQRGNDDGAVVGEFHFRGQNSRLAPLRLQWAAPESLYYGGRLTVLSGPVGLKARFEGRVADRSWLKNNPDRVAGGRPFTESYYATVGFLIAFADAERVQMEFARSPVPMTTTTVKSNLGKGFRDIEDFDRGERNRGESNDNQDRRDVSGSLRAG